MNMSVEEETPQRASCSGQVKRRNCSQIMKDVKKIEKCTNPVERNKKFCEILEKMIDKIRKMKEEAEDIKESVFNRDREGSGEIVDQHSNPPPPTSLRRWNEQLKTNEALDSIALYDGTGCITCFITQIEKVKTLVSNQTHLIPLIVKEKIKVKPPIDTDMVNLKSYPLFYKSLQLLFGSTRSALEKLSYRRLKCVQRPTETVKEFTSRFFLLHRAILRAVRANKIYEKNKVMSDMISYHKTKSLRLFLEGLREEYVNDMTILPSSVEEAATLAMTTEWNFDNKIKTPQFRPVRTRFTVRKKKKKVSTKRKE